MKRIDDQFAVHRARSGLFTNYEPGEVAYVRNSTSDNAVVGFVTPLPGDKVFNFRGIVLSAFCDATVQLPPFVACGRAGNGAVVLEPRAPMKMGELVYYAAYINKTLSWRFNWYRQITADRVRPLALPDVAPSNISFSVKAILPAATEGTKRQGWKPSFRRFPLDEIFDLKGGGYHALNELQPGSIPVVSCGDENNGIAGYFEAHKMHQNRLTIALNGSPLTTKYHPYIFAAKDDVAVCIPRKPIRLTTQLFVQVMANSERWRYSYYRKCYLGKLKRFKVVLPAVNGEPDEDMMGRMITTSPYWGYLSKRLDQTIQTLEET